MKALLLIDIQHDFLPGGALAVPEGDQIIEVVNALQEHFDLIVATRDWHPENHKSFASNHPGKNPFEEIELQGLPQTLWPNHCVQGSPGSGFPDQLQMNKVAAVFRKGMEPEIDSYSGFFDNGRRKKTGLAGYLREMGVKQVYLCGLAGDFCVFFTGLDSLQEGFETFIIKDATRPINPEKFRQAMEKFTGKNGKLIHSNSILNRNDKSL